MGVVERYGLNIALSELLRLLRHRYLWILISLNILVFLVLLPVGMLLFGSIWSADPGFPGEFTLDHYTRLVTGHRFVNTLWVTAIYGFGSTLLATGMALPLAYLLQRTNTPFRDLLSLIIVLPLVINPLITAIAFFAMFSPRSGLYNGILRSIFGLSAPGPFTINSLTGAIVVTAFAVTPIMYIYTMASFTNLNRLHEEAAIITGANAGRRIKDIIIPMTFPALASGFILTLAFAFGLFSIPIVLFAFRPDTDVITTLVFFELWNYPANYGFAAAAALALVLIALILVFLQKFNQARQEQYASVTGKGFTTRVRDIGRLRWASLGFVLTYIFVSTILPVSMLLILSVNGGIMRAQIQLEAWSLADWHALLLGNWTVTNLALRNSLLLGVSAATLTIAFCVVLAWIRREYEGTKLESFIQYSTILSIAMPGIVLAIAFVWVWTEFNRIVGLAVYGTMWVIMFAYITRWIPFGYRAADSAILQIDRSLEEAATVTGASWFRKIRDITLPLAKPGLVAGWQLVFIFSFLELSASVILFTGRTMPVAVHIFNLWNQGEFGQAAVVSIVSLVVIYLVLVALSRLTGVSVKKLSEAV